MISVDLRLDPRDVDALQRAEAAGLTPVAVTGRPFPGAVPWVRRLGLHGPFVCYQGAQVRTPDGALLLDDGVPHEAAMEVVRFCRERNLHVQAYRDDELIVEHDRPEAQKYARHAGMEVHVVGDLDAAMTATTPKLVIVADEERIETLLPEVRARWRGRLYAATSLPDYLEITNMNADKRRALQFLCEQLKVGREETVAVGDGRNDVPMLEWAAVGYAVEGSPQEVIAAAGGRTVGKPGSGGIAALVESLVAGQSARSGERG